MNTDTKKCPFCAEEIKQEASKCKHCGEFINNSNPVEQFEKKIITDKNKNSSTKNIKLNKKYVIIIIVCLLLLVSAISNPNIQTHREAVKTKLNSITQKLLDSNPEESDNDITNLGKEIGSFLGGIVIDKWVETSISCTNYLVFSITKVTWNGEEKNIGFGVLGNVFISDKVSDALKGLNDNESNLTGSVKGLVNFPSEYVDPMKVFLKNIETNEVYTLQTEGSPEFAVSFEFKNIPEGSYVAYAYLIDSGVKTTEFGGGYTSYDPSIPDSEVKNSSQRDHTLIKFNVKKGETTDGITIYDWYGADIPKPN